MFIDAHSLHRQFILKVGAYRGQLENITIIITSTVFVPSYPSHFLMRRNWKCNLERNPCLSKLHEIFNSLCFLVNGLEYLSQAVTSWKCTCPRQGCWCHGQEFTSWESLHLKPSRLIQPWGRKTGWSSFFPSALQKGDLCHGSSLANREVSALNQLYSEGTVCLCLSTLIPKSKTILLQVEYTHSQGLYTYSLFFHCQNHFPCSERGVVLIHASEQ